MTQIDLVRRNTPDFDLRAVRILDRALSRQPAQGLMPGLPFVEALGRHGLSEAIVLAALRPAFFLTDDAIDTSDAVETDPLLLDLVTRNAALLIRAAAGVGRVDLIHHATLPYAGTGFLIEDTLAVTNRHVALVFAERLRTGYGMRPGRFGAAMEARLDYHGFAGRTSHSRAEVVEVLYIARDDEPDFAFLRVAPQAEAVPLQIMGTPLARDRAPVAAIGYPAEDGTRNDPNLMGRIFRGTYGVKRLAPGFVTDSIDSGVTLLADYSSLGGNSGSPVVSLEDGRVVGLHFAGRFMDSNHAVAADVLEAARREVIRRLPGTALPGEAPTSPAVTFDDRNGYDAGFLGTGDLLVPLPGLGGWRAAPVTGADDGVLRYRNFSVIQSADRRLPLVTAVNIDGAQSRMLKRRGEWRLDGRLHPDHQIGNELYRRNPLDRGHMVRRRDPGWGEHAQQAEEDTFHYTNCAPQHEDLNQKDWLGLEDDILGAAETRGFRLSVLTGPVFRDSDRRLVLQDGARDVAIPEEFWKIAVMIDAETGKLSATGYVLSQGRMIRRLVESAFVYGRYKAYQVPLALIAAETGLDFGALPAADPLVDGPAEAAGLRAHPVDGPGNLLLRRRPTSS
ncbi:DNA/RNA non-specific endonuclease [Paracoccus rhizosphaerae]|uniref:DNA/RNA non-specific endonuclease n=1 Tax=Paracoccus rhizosphaerae TaxID=1133347 RepID=A0ABV6CER1_9RHOB|nr:DNA/RNA non-specific endonuclease [Paracoccus rhizosphaerae]